MCKCCLPVPLEIEYRPSYEGPFIRQEYIEFYTPICTDINVLQYMYMYMYIHISVVEMKQLYTTMSKFIAFSNSFCPPMPLGKTFPTKKKSPGVWDGTFGCPSSAKKKGGCLLQMQRWGPGKSPPFFGPRNIYWGGGFRVACSQESLHKNVLLDGIVFLRIGRSSRKYVSQVSKIWSLPTFHYSEASKNIWSPGDVGPCGLKNCKKITSHIWGPPNCFLEVIFLGNSNHHLVPCSKPLKVFSNSYPSLANPRSSIMWFSGAFQERTIGL